MSDIENARAQAESIKSSDRTMTSAERARLWAGLNRYLASEAEHAHRVARQEQEQEQGEGEHRPE